MKLSEMDCHSDDQEWGGPLRSEQVKSLYEALPLSIVANLVNALILVFILRSVIDHTTLSVWMGLLAFVLLVRLLVGIAFRNRASQNEESCRCYEFFLTGSIATATLWGLASFVLFAEGSVPHQAYLAFATAGMGAGAVSALASMRMAVNSFLLIMLLPLISRFILAGDEISYAMATMVSLFLVIVLINANRHYANTEQNIRLRMQSQQSEKALKASVERFRELFEGNRSVELVIDPEDGRIIEANRAAEYFYGYDREVLKSMKISDINILPEAEVVAEMERASQEQRNHFFFKHRLASGDIRDVEVHSGPIQWNQKRALYSIVHDITVRVEAEERLRKLSQAVEHASESVIITDRNGVIEYANPAFSSITGYSTSEAIGNTPSILKSGQQSPQFYEHLWRTITSGMVWKRQLIERRKDGTLYPVVMSIAPIFDSQGEITHYVGIQQDMTEQEMLEQKFHQAQKMDALGTLVGGIAHDFNNMLAGIGGNIYLIKGSLKDMPDVEERLENIEGLTSRATSMIKQLLAFARKGNVETTSFGLTSFINEVSRLSEASIPESINFRINRCPEELVVRGDTTQLQQVIMNLLNNARDAVADIENPTITLSLDEYIADEDFKKKHDELVANRFARLTVEDNGCGIPPGDMEHIFEPFFTTKEVGFGTGLGLSMVYGSVSSQGGTVNVESEPGKGARFEVYLPLLDEALPAGISPGSEKMVKGKGELLLVCDDNSELREMLRSVLERINYRVVLAADGLEAVECFRTAMKEVSLVIMDVVMPELSGVKAYERIRGIDPDARVIFVTGYDRDEALKGEILPEEYLVLSKPYNFNQLSRIIREQIEADL